MRTVGRGRFGAAPLLAGLALLVGCAHPDPEIPAEEERPVAVVKIRKAATKPAKTLVEMPDLPSDASCSAARSAYAEAWSLEDGSERPDLSRGQFGSVLARGSYFDGCRVPARYEVSICAAVQNGQVLGATVRTSPRAPRLERCIDEEVRSLSFPMHPRLDVTTTVFRPAG